MMANFVGLRLPPVVGCGTRCYVVAGCSSSTTTAATLSLIKKWNRRRVVVVKAPRRMLLGFGASSLLFLSQFMSMSGSVPAKSFIASARIKAGPSVDEVRVIHIIKFLFLFFFLDVLFNLWNLI